MEFDRLFEVEIFVRDQPNGLIGSRCRMLVSFFSRTMLTSRSVSLAFHANDHAFVNGDARAREERCRAPAGCREHKRSNPVVICNQRAGRAMRNLSLPLDVNKQRVHKNGARP